MKTLYYIRNRGCDDTTCGLAEISDTFFPEFKTIIENLNRNSTYGCMPTISVYKIDWSNLHTPNAAEDDEDDYLYLNGWPYVVNEDYDYGKERAI